MRTLSGAVYVALVLGAAWSGFEATAMLFLPITGLVAWELHRLLWKDRDSGPHVITSVALALVTYAVWACVLRFPDPHFQYALAITFFALGVAAVLVLRTGTTTPGAVMGHHLCTAFYVALPMACASWMATEGHILIGFMLLLWTNDTGAYLVGKAIGRTKLMPKVSPGKTWEGFLGGLILSIAVAWAIAKYIDTELPGRTWLIASLVVTITSTIGDLMESAIKRAAGVKDSGTIMPGHGGVLDRFDGYLLAAPAMVLLAIWLA